MSIPVRPVMDVSGATTWHLPPAAAQPRLDRHVLGPAHAERGRKALDRRVQRRVRYSAVPVCVHIHRLLNTRSGSPAKGPRSETERAISSSTQLLGPVDAGEPTGGRPDPSFGSILRPYIGYNRSYFVGWVGWTGMSTTGSVPAHCVPSENSTDST